MIRQALTCGDSLPSEILCGKPGQEVFWLVEELISCKRLDTFLDLLKNGQEIIWRNDDIFPFIMFYVMCPFMMLKQLF